MRLGKLCKWIVFCTVLSLTYTHLQIKIIDLAYQGKIKEEQIKKLIEQNGGITYAILTLKSAYHLGGELLVKNSNMRFADPASVVTISASDDYLNGQRLSALPSAETKSYSLLSLLPLGTQAEAKSR